MVGLPSRDSPGYKEVGAGTLWGNSSVAVVALATVALFECLALCKVQASYQIIGSSGTFKNSYFS